MSIEWKESFDNFIKDMGRRPNNKYSIERVDNNGSYCKENCKWATRTEQARNTRRTRHFVVEGKEYHSISMLAESFGVNIHTLNTRLHNGWDAKSAVLAPKGMRYKDWIKEPTNATSQERD